MVRDASDGSRYTSSIKPQGSINDLGKCAAHAMPHVGVAVFGCLLLLNLTAAADLLPPSASQNPLVISPANSTLSHTLTNMTSAAAIVVRPATVHTATYVCEFKHDVWPREHSADISSTASYSCTDWGTPGLGGPQSQRISV